MRPSRIALLACAAMTWAAHVQAFPWPGRVKGRVTGVVGEQRSMYGGREIRSHNGMDLGYPYYAQVDNEVFSVHSGYCHRKEPDDGYSVYTRETAEPSSLQLSGYVHIKDRCETGDQINGLLGEPAVPATVIGKIAPGTRYWPPHLHFILGPGEAGDPAGGSFNPLAEGLLDDYYDRAAPEITAGDDPDTWLVRFCPDRVEDDNDDYGACVPEFPRLPAGEPIVSGKVDVKVRARDSYTNFDGSGQPDSRTGVYALGYGVSDASGVTIKPLEATVQFFVNPHSIFGWSVFAMHPTPPGSQPLHYWVTNQKGPWDQEVKDSSWNTKKAAGSPEADAQVLRNALYPDGRVRFEACVWDIRNNSDCHQELAVVDNFKPRVVDFVVTGAGSSLDRLAKIDDPVTINMWFDQEMDPTRQPELSLVEGARQVTVADGEWFVVQRDGRTVSEFRGAIRIPELGRQDSRVMRLEVRSAKGLGPEDRDVMEPQIALDDDMETPLELFADLVRPRPAVAGVLEP
jgi:hypothetical protein